MAAGDVKRLVLRRARDGHRYVITYREGKEDEARQALKDLGCPVPFEVALAVAESEDTPGPAGLRDLPSGRGLGGL